MPVDPSPQLPAPNLEWRVRLFGAGAILGVVGMWADQGWLVNVAIAVLLLAFLLRFRADRDETSQDDVDEGSTT